MVKYLSKLHKASAYEMLAWQLCLRRVHGGYREALEEISIIDSIAIGVDRIHRNFDPCASKLRDGGPTRSRMNRQVLSSIAHSSRINSMFRGIWHATFTRTIWVASSCRRVIAVNSA